jgi:hypothetical protein
MKVALLADARNRHTLRWSQWLSSNGYEVVVCSDRPARESFDFGAVRVLRPEWNLWRNLYAFKWHGGPLANSRFKHLAWAPVLDRERPEILHAHEAVAYGPMLHHFPEYPRVLTPWGTDVERLADADPEWAFLIRQGLHAADVVTTNGPGLEAHWSRLSLLPQERFSLWSWGVDIDIYQPEPRVGDQELVSGLLGIPADTPVHLSPRLAKPYYNVSTIIAGWGQFAGSGCESRLVVMRSGADDDSWSAVLAAIAELQAPESVIPLETYLDEQALAALYRRSTGVIMLPETDLLSMSFLEACGCGAIPVVPPIPVYTSCTGAGEQAAFRGLVVDEITPDAVAAAFSQLEAMPAGQLADWRSINAAAVRRDHDRNQCMTRIHDVYQSARRGFASF